MNIHLVLSAFTSTPISLPVFNRASVFLYNVGTHIWKNGGTSNPA
jgi:hypothetical protein